MADQRPYVYGKWRAGYACVACRAPLREKQLTGSGGVCPACGHAGQYPDEVEIVRTTVQEAWYSWRQPFKRLWQHIRTGPILAWSGDQGLWCVVEAWEGTPSYCLLRQDMRDAEQEAARLFSVNSKEMTYDEALDWLRSHDSAAAGPYSVTVVKASL